ncbi:hypothetical protein PR048_010956 [Dryococelus australis]|uniref:Uncharacterized protein n=1 Tax=Dryococelus australis TaxID=614101 RepID=A0ABQ9HK82_9NEOP|nr:hypothetical protein PR048_010956 [Dryococelus australis]
MGLLLSVLVVCVGVLEVIACIRHFQSGYLPLWAPHHVVPGFTNLHELWRTKPNSDYDCFTMPGEIASSDDSLYLANSVQYYRDQLDISSLENISELTHEEILFSDTDCADNAPGIDSALSSRQNVFGSKETDRKDICFDDITLRGNNSGLRHNRNSQDIDVLSNNILSLDTTESNLSSCAHAESLLQQDFVSYSDNLVDSEESASQDKPFDSEILKFTSPHRVTDKSSEVSNTRTEVSSPSREIRTVSSVDSSFQSYSAELYSEVDLPNEQQANETGGFRKEFSAKAGDVVTENSIFCGDKIETFPRDCKDNFVASTDELDELDEIVDPETHSPAPYTSASSIETTDSMYQLLEQSASCNIKDESESILKKNGKDVTGGVGPHVSTPGTPRKSKADIKWPTFTAVPVIKRPSVPFTTETLTSFENFDIIDDITDVSFDSKNTCVSEKSEKPCGGPVNTEGKSIPVLEEAGKNLDSEAIDSAADENKDNVGDSISDLGIIEESPISVLPGNEFSKKEIMLKRRRSYKSRRQSSSLESASGSERDDRSLSEERTGVRESRRRLRNYSKTNSAEDAACVEKAEISSSNLSRSLSNPDSNSAGEFLQNSQTSADVKPGVLDHNPRNECLMAENLATGVQTVDEEIVQQLDNMIQDERKNIISPPPDNSSVTYIAPTNEDLSESEKKASSKEAFWVS